MVGTNLKAETFSLMDKRTNLESEMNTIIDRLSQPGGPGLSGNLLDSEGFPRADFDIPSIRADRNRLSVLRNDHKDLTEKINQNIEVLHSGKKTDHISSSPTINTGSNSSMIMSSSSMDVDIKAANVPFAFVDEISESCPAAEDGLQLGDQIVSFGSVDSRDNLLQRLAAEAQTNRDHPVTVVVLRQGALVDLKIVPRQWQGRGLLGCHFQLL
ncbi:26S proteasome non-ATPase regulatory subunit 9 [Impatiens glandulifera]|uniref:26S proteasome non-ATPase regulatory subunit 9 n=1 Tax=Impatiens glandulifera TaxID=253017 RepID=UPI001FB0D506|nr:26S proteasome non-ATPase regulatory subunit 9 [Impatiens glandulifera]